MEQAEIILVQESFAKIEPISDLAATLFYKKLFELDPSLESFFEGDMAEQSQKLMQMLAVAVNGLSSPETIIPAVQALGRRHVHYGVVESHYATVGEALLWALAEGLEDEFTPDVKTAWISAYTLLSSVMLEAAATADQPLPA